MRGLYHNFPVHKTFILHLYGCQLWNLTGRSADKLWSTWNILIRSLFRLPLATHRYLLEAISATVHMKVIVKRRFLKFHNKLAVSSNPLIKNLLKMQRCDMRSTFGRNVHAVCTQEIDSVAHPTPEGEEWRVQMLEEIIARRDDVLTIENFTEGEEDVILQHICCT